MTSVKEKLNQGWIRCSVMLEILGKPADYIDEIMRKVVSTMEGEANITVLDKKFNEPKEVENGLFSTFSELELLMKNMATAMEFILSYMPSHIEIIEPSEMKFGMLDANEFLNRFAGKVHQYDEVLKRTDIENVMLKNKIAELERKVNKDSGQDSENSKEE